ncbi:MAG: hypothetical protein DME34_01905 [Verrucomicrobia bacterium]|nr:MAG: hypothetical protein DME34_01905 [Verrucomicrobiota bacterium]
MDAGMISAPFCSAESFRGVGRESDASAGATPATTGARSETEAHRRLKRLALIWAQAQGYSACALEVRLPRCHYRVDLAAYRPNRNGAACTAAFECKQALVDLRRDNGASEIIRQRLQQLYSRRQLLESKLRIHYPQLRIPDSLFTEFDSHDFAAIGHRGYTRVTRELSALQHRLFDGTKFEKLIRYRCANLFYLVLPNELFRSSEIPLDWGVLIESDGVLTLARKPLWHDSAAEIGVHLLERIAAAGTRNLNRQFDIQLAQPERLRAG